MREKMRDNSRRRPWKRRGSWIITRLRIGIHDKRYYIRKPPAVKETAFQTLGADEISAIASWGQKATQSCDRWGAGGADMTAIRPLADAHGSDRCAEVRAINPAPLLSLSQQKRMPGLAPSAVRSMMGLYSNLGGQTILGHLLRFVDVRPQEAPKFLLMASYFFLAMACVATIKPLQASLYLAEQGFDWKWPVIYAGLALLAGPIAVLHRFLTSRYAHLSIASGTLGFFILSLAFFAFALRQNAGFWTCFLFVVWSGIFSLLLPTLGWVIAYDLFTVREAKRLFALLGTGGILGGICGGFCTALVGKHLLWLLIQVLLMLLLLQGTHSADLSRAPQSQRTQTGNRSAAGPGSAAAGIAGCGNC